MLIDVVKIKQEEYRTTYFTHEQFFKCITIHINDLFLMLNIIDMDIHIKSGTTFL